MDRAKQRDKLSIAETVENCKRQATLTGNRPEKLCGDAPIWYTVCPKTRRRENRLRYLARIPAGSFPPIVAGIGNPMKPVTAIAALLTLLFGLGPAAETGTAGPNGACVVLLHGLARTSNAMEPLAEALRAAGYRTANIDYPSTEKPIEELALAAVPEGLGRCRQTHAAQVHFVTHSMGGILVRYYLTQEQIPELGRTVMLSPPNRGSEVTDRLKETAIYQWVNGPAGRQLGTGPDGIAQRLPPVDYPVGIITGNSSSDPWFSPFIPGEDDGKVSVESARLDEMRDFLVVEAGHTFIMSNRSVLEQILHFLQEGTFKR